MVQGLPVEPLKFEPVNLAGEVLRQKIQSPEAGIVAGALVFPAGVAKAGNEPALVSSFLKHGLEQVRDGGAAVDVVDGPGKDRGHIQELNLAAGGVAGFGDGVQEEHLLDGALLQPFIGGAGENAVGGAGVDLLGAAHIDQSPGGVAQGAGGVHHVVVQDAGLVPNVADDVHDLGDVGLGTALIHDGQAHVNLGGKVPGAAHGAHIGGDHNEIVVVEFGFRELIEIVFHKRDVAQQMIQRNVEEALNLGGVEVHGQDAVSAGSGEHIGHQLGGDGVAGLGLAVLTGVAKVGDDGGDPAGGGPAAGVDHYQQLHEMVIDRFAGGLDKKHVRAADSLFQGDRGLAVGEMLNNSLSHGNAQLLADGLRKLGVGIAAEDPDVLAVSNHQMNPSLY